jgi:hypothetical protein
MKTLTLRSVGALPARSALPRRSSACQAPRRIGLARRVAAVEAPQTSIPGDEAAAPEAAAAAVSFLDVDPAQAEQFELEELDQAQEDLLKWMMLDEQAQEEVRAQQRPARSPVRGSAAQKQGGEAGLRAKFGGAGQGAGSRLPPPASSDLGLRAGQLGAAARKRTCSREGGRVGSEAALSFRHAP